MMTPRERVISALSLDWVDRPPVCCLTTSVTLDQMRAVGAYLPEANTDPMEMAILARAANTVVGFESMRVPFCLTVEAEALGATVDLGKVDRAPMVKGHNLKLGEEVPIPDPISDAGRIPVVLEALSHLQRMSRGEVPVVPLALGPFTLAGHLVGVEALLLGIVLDPEAVHRLLAGCSDFCGRYLEILDGAGVDVILVSNPSASAEILSPQMHAEFSARYTRRCLQRVREAMTVIHICGESTSLLENMISLGTNGLSVEEKVDPYQAREIVGRRAALVGNVGVVRPLLQGTPEEVFRDTKVAMDAGFDIINPGCGLAPKVPFENLRAMVRAVKGY